MGRTSDTCKHVTRSHDKGSEDRDDSPCPATLENGREEAERQDESENTDSGRDPTSPIYGIFVWNRDGGVLRKVDGQWPSLESAAGVINNC
jgi:hypothetical protein